MSWTFVQHVHTRHSFDSRADPAKIVRRAAEVGIEVLAVTDHDTWRGAIEAREAATRLGLGVRVVIGSEVRTSHGDVIGLFLDKDIVERDALKFCDAVHEQGGLVVLPHPYKWHQLDDDLMTKVDIVEVHNSRCTPQDNIRAAELALERNLATVVGPDAHRVSELLLARTEFDGDPPADDAAIKHALLHAPRRFFTTPGSMWDEWMSQVAKFSRHPSPVLAWGLVRGLVRRFVKPQAYRPE